MSRFSPAIAGLVVLLCLPAHASGWRTVAARFECDRIYAELSVKGRVRRFFTDSGGGLNPFTYRDTVRDWGVKLPPFVEVGGDAGARVATTAITWPRGIGWPFFPKPGETVELRVFDCAKASTHEACVVRGFMRDGFLGAAWFADRAWRLDYARGTVEVATKLGAPPPRAPRVPLGFRVEAGRRTHHQPRLGVEVDGRALDLLFDTGATASYTAEARAVLGLGDTVYCSASFLRRSRFDQLRAAHPDWKFVPQGDGFGGGSDLLEVPEVKLGGQVAGPVWFAARPDAVYDRYSSGMMDARIEGAIGGNAFRGLRITADYPGAGAYFERR